MFRQSKKSFVVGSLVTVALLGATAVGYQEARWALSFRQEKLSIEGVANFGRVHAHLYRGAQPTDAGFGRLRDSGVDTVVRLSLGEEGSAAERSVVESLGMRFVNLPWSSVHDPHADQIAAFLTLVREHPDRTVFVHCKAGADRTGTFVALYRIAVDKWTPALAVEEMKAFRYRWLFLPHLEAYVHAFPSKLNSEPAFIGLEAAAVLSTQN